MHFVLQCLCIGSYAVDVPNRVSLTHRFCTTILERREAASRAIALAELVNCPIQIFHVTCAEVAEEIQRVSQLFKLQSNILVLFCAHF